mmetsp:Transcript_36819/g.105227  ORF Transcript_36819/g.105227 Transcript_36819/m.105227 type:complete len:83 (+) Transcript_36819:316-564(+)
MKLAKKRTVTRTHVKNACNGLLREAGDDCTEFCFSFASIAFQESASMTLTWNMFKQDLANSKRGFAVLCSSELHQVLATEEI